MNSSIELKDCNSAYQAGLSNKDRQVCIVIEESIYYGADDFLIML